MGTRTSKLAYDPRDLIQKIDPALTYVRVLGEGVYNILFLVQEGKDSYALKVNLFHEAYQIDEHFTLKNEYKILKALADVPHIPKVYKLYPHAPTATDQKRLGKNALLLTYIPGTTLKQSGKQSLSFFMKLSHIIDAIYERGYSIPLVDFNANNIMVDERNEPWLIDFMCAIKLDRRKDVAARQKALGTKRLQWVIEEFSD